MKENQGVAFKPNPFEQFRDWHELAIAQEINDPEAMSLATAGADGMPNVRMVLCKSFDATGIQFFTNLESPKGLEIAQNPRVALCFHWKSLRRQVRVQGTVIKLPEAEDDAYFHERHRESQMSTWAAQQSRPLANMMKLTTDVHALHQRFANQVVPRPSYWGGYLVTPQTIEFWAERPHRLHERMLYTRNGKKWVQQRLYP